MFDGQHNVANAIRHGTIQGMLGFFVGEYSIKTRQAGGQNRSSVVAECLKNLENLGEQGVNEEVIRNVAGLVYIGKPAIFSYLIKSRLHLGCSNGRYSSYPQALDTDSQFDELV